MDAMAVDSHRGEGLPMEAPAAARLFDAFAHVSDPRRANARHRWCNMFVIALCAVSSGAEGWEAREEEGHAQAEWCQQCLDLPHGMPSPDPLRRGLSRLQPDALTQGFVRWTEALRALLDGAMVAMDGKTLRRSFAHAASQGVIPMVSAWATAHRLV